MYLYSLEIAKIKQPQVARIEEELDLSHIADDNVPFRKTAWQCLMDLNS